MNQPFLERSWELLKKFLISQSLSATNIAALEHTYAHWFAQLEHVPMNVPLEDALGPLYEAELAAIMTDFHDYPPNERRNHKEKISSFLQMTKKFISNFGVTTYHFFEQDKTGGVSYGMMSGKKGKSKGVATEKAFGGKLSRRRNQTSASTTQEPATQEKTTPVSKTTESVSQEKTAPASKATEPVQEKTAEQTVPSADTQKVEATTTPTTKSAGVAESAKTSVPSKPQKPPVQEELDDKHDSDDDDDDDDDEENQDLQAALQASLKAPSNPQIPSGAQSSDPKGKYGSAATRK